jgi:ubiquinone/menaquinone biosynthesis C-methylase UbiE
VPEGRARAYCADVIDQQARYGGEFVKLLSAKLERHGHTLPLDRFEANVTDAMNLMYRDELFDFVCSVNAFEHIPDPARALQEIARVLKRGGIAYISFDPIWTADSGSHYSHRVPDPWAHLVLSDEEFVARMRESGAEQWEVDEFRFAMNRVRLPTFETIFFGRARELGLEVAASHSWAGLVSESHRGHTNFQLALKEFPECELLTRGLAFALKRL